MIGCKSRQGSIGSPQTFDATSQILGCSASWQDEIGKLNRSPETMRTGPRKLLQNWLNACGDKALDETAQIGHTNTHATNTYNGYEPLEYIRMKCSVTARMLARRSRDVSSGANF